MYNISRLPYFDDLRLMKIHYTVMVPIINYYFTNFNKKSSDIEIYAINFVSSNIGKEIVFRIDGITSAQLISDIMNNCGVGKYIYKADTYYNYVDLIIEL